ncbi:MAG TPA: hypothetical protein VGF13_08320 [Verrucomicrobiae bacterium]|jgi:hypothetical protein
MSSEPGESVERWLRPLPFGIFLAAALFACCPQVWLGWESFYSRDYGALAYPNIHFQREFFWRGELPFWNPYSNCGQPFLAQWGTMALYPGALVYLLLPLPWSLSIFCFLHVWLGGFGMYLLARRWTETNFAAALAGTIYVFNGIMFASFVWPNYLATLGWMPLVVLLTERAWRESGRWMVGAAMVAAMQMLAGAPEVILFTWLIVGVLFVCDAARSPVSSFPFFRRMIYVVLLTTGLAAVQLLPFFELLQHSHREAGFATDKWQFPLWGWGNFLVPLYNAFETPSGQYYQYSQGFLSSVYLGGVAVTFALLALFRWPDLRVWALWIVAILCVALAFGEQTPIFKTLRQSIPLVGIGRYPVKFLFVLAFIVPLLAGCGFAAVVKSRLRHGVLILSVLVLAAMIFLAWAVREHRFVDYAAWPENFRANVDYSWNKTRGGKPWPDGVMNTGWRMGLFVVTIAALCVASRGHARFPLLAVAALALVATDGRIHSPKMNPSLPSSLFRRHYWPEEFPQPQLGEARVLITPGAEEFLTFVASTNVQRLWEFKRRAEWSSLNLIDHVAKVNGSSTLQTREERMVEQTLYSMTNRLPAGLMDFLGVAFITGSNSSAEWLSRTDALPLVTTGQQPRLEDNAAALAAMTQETFNPRQTVFLSGALPKGISASNAANATVTNLGFSAHSVEADVRADAPALLVIAQSFYPAWRATVDGVNTSLHRANVAFQAVTVPAGQHHVRVFYSDSQFRSGLLISSASLLLCAVIWIRSRHPLAAK